MKHFLLFTAVCFCFSVLSAAPHYLFFTPRPAVETVPPLCAAAPENMRVTAPLPGTGVQLLSDIQKNYLDMPRNGRIAFFADRESRKIMRSGGWHQPEVRLEWEALPSAASYTVLISENPDLSDSVCVERISVPYLALRNLKIASVYYWQVFALADNCSVEGRSPVADFRTVDRAPRLMWMGELGNTRDLGGRTGLDGRRVRQGMIYRTAGLNDIASFVPDAPEVVLAEHPELRTAAGRLDAGIAALREQLDALPQIDVLPPFSAAGEWKVYRPDIKFASDEQIRAFLALNTAPADYLGAAAVVMRSGDDGGIRLDGGFSMKPAFFFREFTAPSDGVMRIGCGADWFWAFSCNGAPLVDFSASALGNRVKPFSAGNYILDIPVRRGRNVLAAYVGAGSDGWSWYCGAPSRPCSRGEALGVMICDLAAAEYEFSRSVNSARLAECRSAASASDSVVCLPWLLKDEWIAYLPDKDKSGPDKIREFFALNSAPAEYLGAAAVTLRSRGNAGVEFAAPSAGRPAYLMQEFYSGADGVMRIGCGADWFWAVAVNGEILADLTPGKRGNARLPVSAENYVLDIPVRKGRNVLSVCVCSGMDGWRWCCAPPPPLRSSAETLCTRMRFLEMMREDLFSSCGSVRPGRNWIDAGTQTYMVDILGIRSDVDLRSDSECSGMTGSPLGPRVKWYQYPSGCYGGMTGRSARDAFTKEFRVFLDESSYPVDFHCWGGQDRTGSLAFILNALLGVDEEELWLDWEATGFWNPSNAFRHDLLFDSLIRVLGALPGENMREKCENYVLSLGFTRDDIEKFRSIMLEPAAE